MEISSGSISSLSPNSEISSSIPGSPPVSGVLSTSSPLSSAISAVFVRVVSWKSESIIKSIATLSTSPAKMDGIVETTLSGAAITKSPPVNKVIPNGILSSTTILLALSVP